MKFVKVLLCVFALLLLLLLTACSPQPSVSVSSSNPTASQSQPLYSEESQPETGGGLLPLAYFDSDEMLIAAIKEAKNNNKNDDFDLASISELYKPATVPENLYFEEIQVKKTYISYCYVNQNQIEYANFTWFREMKPEVAMNGLYGRGAISEREIEYNGIKYVFLEWADFETGKSDGYSIHWVSEGRAYQAYIKSIYTDEEILEFCQYATVPVE
ncbi:hypothetical protein [Christensenella tenuis]|uniref:Lipoprotein n=1 Tax=Christensenella tenuis TaxID=2763033 RepID=A0ABR7EG57_9FIRM|nr:hypothetical protein [Christensenella tenuis]MBC5648124.1 hypothetical protein [Christensenella tenuis]